MTGNAVFDNIPFIVLLIFRGNVTCFSYYPFSNQWKENPIEGKITPNRDQYLPVGSSINFTCSLSIGDEPNTDIVFLLFIPEDPGSNIEERMYYYDVGANYVTENWRNSELGTKENASYSPSTKSRLHAALDTAQKIDSIYESGSHESIDRLNSEDGATLKRLARNGVNVGYAEMQWRLDEARIRDSGLYRCCVKGRRMDGDDYRCFAQTFVSVGDPPSAISIDDMLIFSDNFDDLNVVICDKDKNVQSYEMRWSMGNQRTKRVCLLSVTANNCTLCAWTKRGFHNKSNKQLFIPRQLYTISVSATNDYGVWNGDYSAEFSVDTNDLSIVIPRPVENLEVPSVGSKSAIIKYGYPGDLNSYTALNFSIIIFDLTSDEILETLNLQDTTDITLYDLNPYTLYRVTVSCIPEMGRLWSHSAEVTFTTESIAPSVTPEFLEGGMYLDDKNHKILIFWKEIPRRNYNGPNFTYVLNVNGSQSFTISTTDIQAVIKSTRIRSIALACQNSLGRSSFSVLDFNTYITKNLEANIVGEIDADAGIAYLSCGAAFNSSSFSIFFCKYSNFTCKRSTMQHLRLSGGRLNATLKNIDDANALTFFVSINFANRSTGLRRICMRRFYGVPPKPESFKASKVDDKLLLEWENPMCQEGSGMTVEYKLQINNYTNFLPATCTNYTISDWSLNDPSVNITLTSLSRSGSSTLVYTWKIPTDKDASKKIYVTMAIIIVISLLLILVIILCASLKYKRSGLRSFKNIKPPEALKEKHSNNYTYASIVDSGYYSNKLKASENCWTHLRPRNSEIRRNNTDCEFLVTCNRLNSISPKRKSKSIGCVADEKIFGDETMRMSRVSHTLGFDGDRIMVLNPFLVGEDKGFSDEGDRLKAPIDERGCAGREIDDVKNGETNDVKSGVKNYAKNREINGAKNDEKYYAMLLEKINGAANYKDAASWMSKVKSNSDLQANDNLVPVLPSRLRDHRSENSVEGSDSNCDSNFNLTAKIGGDGYARAEIRRSLL